MDDYSSCVCTNRQVQLLKTNSSNVHDGQIMGIECANAKITSEEIKMKFSQRVLVQILLYRRTNVSKNDDNQNVLNVETRVSSLNFAIMEIMCKSVIEVIIINKNRTCMWD